MRWNFDKKSTLWWAVVKCWKCAMLMHVGVSVVRQSLSNFLRASQRGKLTFKEERNLTSDPARRKRENKRQLRERLVDCAALRATTRPTIVCTLSIHEAKLVDAKKPENVASFCDSNSGRKLGSSFLWGSSKNRSLKIYASQRSRSHIECHHSR